MTRAQTFVIWREPRRRQGGRDAARGGLRRAPGAGGPEPERPYERPPLSKDYLRGEVGREKVYVHDAGFYDEQAIELRTEPTATAIDPRSAPSPWPAASAWSGTALLLATGAEPRRLALPGADLDGVCTCATWPTASASARRSPRAAGWSWSAPAGSARRSPPRRASSVWR